MVNDITTVNFFENGKSLIIQIRGQNKNKKITDFFSKYGESYIDGEDVLIELNGDDVEKFFTSIQVTGNDSSPTQIKGLEPLVYTQPDMPTLPTSPKEEVKKTTQTGQKNSNKDVINSINVAIKRQMGIF